MMNSQCQIKQKAEAINPESSDQCFCPSNMAQSDVEKKHVEFQLQLQLYTAKSQYWLHKAGASPEHWQIKINKLLKKV